MQAAPIRIPDLQENLSGRLLQLMVVEGQQVRENQAAARIEISGIAVDLSCPQDGFVVGLRALPGQLVHPREVLCYICQQPSIGSKQPAADLRESSPPLDATRLIIFGGGGHGKTVIDALRALNMYHIAGIVDDGLRAGSEVLGVPVLGGASELEALRQQGIGLAVNAVGGIGNVNVRLKVFDLLAQAGFSFPVIVHPSAVVERSAALEAGVQVLAQAYVGSDARVGFGTVINTAAIVHHDCAIGQVVNLSPGATLAGSVSVEDHAQIGMRATVNLQVKVGRGALLGNGCTVKADVPANTRVYAGTIWPVRKPEG